MKKIQSAFILAIAVLFIVPASALAADVEDVKFFVKMYYYGDMPKNLDSMKTIPEVMDALDEYSRYLSADEYVNYIAAVGEAPVPKPYQSESPHISSYMLYGNTGYIKIPTFPANLGEHVASHWNKLKKAGATDLILDLRFNGGGYVDSAEELLGFFQGVDHAYRLKTREGSRLVKPQPSKVKFPKQTYLLVNRYSASASEIVAAALKDQEAGIVVGETTKGKGSVQSFFEFEDGTALKLTTGHFTGPKGTPVHKKGIKPTIPAKPGEELTMMHTRLLHNYFQKKNYKATEKLTNVPRNKIFHVQYTQPMNFSDKQTSDTVDLVKLGGVAVRTNNKSSANHTLDIHPNNLLQPGGQYILVTHPGMANKNGRTVKQGTYTPVTVQTTK